MAVLVQMPSGAVERDGVQADRAWAGAAHDEHRGPGILRQRRSDRPPRVADVVRDARDRRRVEAVGDRYEHVVGVRHAHEVREEAAPLLDRGPEAVGGHERHLAAVPGPTAPARLALAAGDLEGNADELALTEGRHRVAGVDDLCDALVAEREGRRKGRVAADDQCVEVAGGHRERTHEGGPVRAELRLGCLAPLEVVGGGVGELLHGELLLKYVDRRAPTPRPSRSPPTSPSPRGPA
jgi:hypothetical protein